MKITVTAPLIPSLFLPCPLAIEGTEDYSIIPARISLMMYNAI
jgi:hypothetical protein